MLLEKDLESGRIIVPHVRQNFFKPAPAPFEIAGRGRVLKFVGGGGFGVSAPVLGESAAAAFDLCDVDGSHVQQSVDLTTGVTLVTSSLLIARPFRIVHVFFSVDVVNHASGVLIKIAGDVDTTGGVNTSGVGIEPYSSGIFSLRADSLRSEFYPNFKVFGSNQSIKMVFVNGSAVTINFQCIASFVYIG